MIIELTSAPDHRSYIQYNLNPYVSSSALTKMSPPPCLRLLAWLYITFWLMPTALSQSVIESLPGFPGKLPFQLETGYIGVGGESGEIQLFYYFIESENNPQNDPLFLWLTGGPGCSGLSALFYEIGPLHIDYANSTGDIPSLVYNPYSYTKVANIIFLDQPAGTGYSYAETPEDYESSGTLSAKITYDFLNKWLITHPKFLNNPLYITGGSYSGITIPLVVDLIYNGIEAGSKPSLNIKGYIMENPITDMVGKYGDVNGRFDYAHRMGLLSDELYTSAKENCNGYYITVDPDNDLCKEDLEKVNECLDRIDLSQILEPSCPDIVAKEKKLPLFHHHMPSYEETARRFLQSSAPLRVESWCRPINKLYSIKWANDELVQKALHIREGTIVEWIRCNHTLSGNFFTYDVNSSVDYHRKLSHKDCRALIYSGDHDMGAPHTVTEGWIRSLKLETGSEWRPWFVEDQIAGYTVGHFRSEHGQTYNLTYATVKGAGHTPPEYKPKQCFHLLQRWLDSSPL